MLCPLFRPPAPPRGRAHGLQQEHVLDCRSHLCRSGKPFHYVMSISFSYFLREKSSRGDKRMQSAVRLGGPGHALGQLFFSPSRASSGDANVRAQLVQTRRRPERQGCLQALARSAVCSRLGWGDGPGSEALCRWSVSQRNCLNREYLNSRSAFDSRRRRKFLGALEQRLSCTPCPAFLMRFSPATTATAVCFVARAGSNRLGRERSSGYPFCGSGARS